MDIEFFNGGRYGYSREAILKERERRKRIHSPIILKEHDGYIPLLLVYAQKNNYESILPVSDYNWTLDSAKYKIESSIRRFDEMISFEKNPREYNNRMTSTVIISGFTLLGFDGSSHPLYSLPLCGNSELREDNVNYMYNKPIDIFTLSLVPINSVNSIVIDNNVIRLDSDNIKVLISRKKFKSPAYMTDNYNGTVRNHLRKNLFLEMDRYNIEREIVDDDVIKQYYDYAFHINTRSIVDMMELDKEVKSSAFINIKKVVQNAVQSNN